MTAEEIDQLLAKQPPFTPGAARSPSSHRAGLSPSGEAAIALLRRVPPPSTGPSDAEMQARRAAARAERRASVIAQREKLWPRIRSPRLAGQLRSVDSPCGLLLGPSGVGKTSAARWVSVRYPGCWVTARDLGAAERHHPLGEGWAPLIRMAITAAHLYLDDIGTEEPRDLGSIQHVIDQRYSLGRATFVTTGLTPADLSGYLGAAYVRRLVRQHVLRRDGAEWPVLFVDCRESQGVTP
jgi:hypothetical protein